MKHRRRDLSRFVLLMLLWLYYLRPDSVLKVWGQERSFTVLLLPPVVLTQTEESRVYFDSLYSSLEQSITGQKFQVLNRQILETLAEYNTLRNENFLTAERVVPLGRSVRADVVVASSFGLEGRRMFIHIKGFDVRTSRLAAAVSETGFAGLAGFRFTEQASLRFAENLSLYRETYDPNELITLEAIVSLRFLSSDEGMQVFLDQREPSGTIVKGEVEIPYVPLRVDDTILVRKEKEGYYPSVEKVSLQPGENRIPLKPLQKQYKNEVGVGWTLGETYGLGAEYRRYLLPDYTFLSFNGRFYVQYDTLPGSKPVLHSDFSCSLGEYLFTPHDARVRLGVTLGAGVSITSFTESEMPIYTDYYLNLGSPFLELNYSPLSYFVMVRLQYGLGMGNHLLGRKLFEIEQGGIPITLGVRRKW
ncbi:MAG: hypothetical protein SNJ78_13175 [Spirochaetales bacterium]